MILFWEEEQVGECYQLLHSIFFTRWCGQNETGILIQVNDTFEVSHIFFFNVEQIDRFDTFDIV